MTNLITQEEITELWNNNVKELIIPPKSTYIELSAIINQKEYFFVYQWNIFLNTPHLLKIKINEKINTNWIILHNCFFSLTEQYRKVYDLAFFVLSDNNEELGKNRNDISKTHHIYYTDWNTYDKLIQYFFNQKY